MLKLTHKDTAHRAEHTTQHTILLGMRDAGDRHAHVRPSEVPTMFKSEQSFLQQAIEAAVTMIVRESLVADSFIVCESRVTGSFIVSSLQQQEQDRENDKEVTATTRYQ